MFNVPISKCMLWMVKLTIKIHECHSPLLIFFWVFHGSTIDMLHSTADEVMDVHLMEIGTWTLKMSKCSQGPWTIHSIHEGNDTFDRLFFILRCAAKVVFSCLQKYQILGGVWIHVLKVLARSWKEKDSLSGSLRKNTFLSVGVELWMLRCHCAHCEGKWAVHRERQRCTSVFLWFHQWLTRLKNGMTKIKVLCFWRT